MLVGCEATYNLEINEDLNLKEEISALEDESYNDLAHDFLLDRISVSFSTRYDEIYDYTVISDKSKLGNKMTKRYDSLANFIDNSKVLKDLVKNYNIKETGDIISFDIIASDKMYNRGDNAYVLIPQNLSINITTPFLVTNTNADKKSGNTYTWNINENQRMAHVILSFDKTKLADHIYVLNFGVSYDILLVIGIGLVLIVTTLIIIKKIRGINKI